MRVSDPDGRRADLMRQIRLAPDDDAPRLVLADWLQERGDPYGAFIAAQCALARAKPRRDRDAYDALRRRERALWGEHGAGWCAALGATRRELTFARGFVRAVEVQPRTGRLRVEPMVPAILDQPVEALSVGFEPQGPSDTEVGALRAWLDHGAPPSVSLHAMAFPNVDRAEPVERALGTLLATPGLARVRHLHLAWLLIADPGAWAAALTANPALTELRSLGVSIGGALDGVRSVLTRPAASRLERLELRHNHLAHSLPVREVLAACPPTIRSMTVTRGVATDADGWPEALAGLERLRWDVPLDPLALARLLRAAGPSRTLRLGIALGQGHVDALRWSLERSLRRLGLRDARPDPYAVVALMKQPLGGLELFDGSRALAGFGDREVALRLGRALARDRAGVRLTTLGFGEAKLSGAGLAALAETGALADVEDLAMGELDPDAVALLDASAPNVRILRVDGCRGPGCDALATSALAQRLEQLDVRALRGGAAVLAEAELPALGSLRVHSALEGDVAALRSAAWLCRLDRVDLRIRGR